MKSITAKELSQKGNSINIIDVRGRLEYLLGKKASGSKNIPMMMIMSQPDKFLDKSQQYYIVCASGARSSNVCKVLAEKGYRVINVVGGMRAY